MDLFNGSTGQGPQSLQGNSQNAPMPLPAHLLPANSRQAAINSVRDPNKPKEDKKTTNPLQEQQKQADKAIKEMGDTVKKTLGATVTAATFTAVTAVGISAPLAAAAAAAAGKITSELVDKTVKMVQSQADKALKAVADIISFFSKALGLGDIKLDFKKLKDQGVAALSSFADQTLGQIKNNPAVAGLVKAVHGLEDDAKNVRNLVEHIGNAAEHLEKGAKAHIEQGVVAADRAVEQQRLHQQQQQQQQKDHENYNKNELANSMAS
ncbi:UNVERIFIED_CONTAM: hypothetical protein HDU68_012803 [Siphonaria sp. JEL0065]|nr:hypothetical protein HDU68_012803 [Siphonaria sp. JEL0065]